MPAPVSDGASFASAMSRCHGPVVWTRSPAVGLARWSTKPTGKVPSYAPSDCASTAMCAPSASTLLTTNAPVPLYCAWTIAVGRASAGTVTVALPVPSTAVTVPIAAPPTFVTGVLVIVGGIVVVVVGPVCVVVVRGGPVVVVVGAAAEPP